MLKILGTKSNINLIWIKSNNLKKKKIIRIELRRRKKSKSGRNQENQDSHLDNTNHHLENHLEVSDHLIEITNHYLQTNKII